MPCLCDSAVDSLGRRRTRSGTAAKVSSPFPLGLLSKEELASPPNDTGQARCGAPPPSGGSAPYLATTYIVGPVWSLSCSSPVVVHPENGEALLAEQVRQLLREDQPVLAAVLRRRPVRLLPGAPATEDLPAPVELLSARAPMATGTRTSSTIQPLKRPVFRGRPGQPADPARRRPGVRPHRPVRAGGAQTLRQRSRRHARRRPTEPRTALAKHIAESHGLTPLLPALGDITGV
jgi:hypothetical protein